MPGLGQFLERRHCCMRRRLAEFAARRVGHGLGNILDDIRPFSVSQSHCSTSLSREAGKPCQWQRNCLASKIQHRLSDSCQWVVQQDVAQYRRRFRLQRC